MNEKDEANFRAWLDGKIRLAERMARLSCMDSSAYGCYAGRLEALVEVQDCLNEFESLEGDGDE